MPSPRSAPYWLILLLLLSYWLMVSSLRHKSATVDEQSHLFRGVAYVQANATHFLWGHPLLASSLNALPLLTEPALALPQDTPAWTSPQWWPAADVFLWQRHEAPQAPLRLIFLGRLVTVWLTLLVGAVLFRWAQAWAGQGGLTAVFVAALWLLDPNVLAHGRLITSDIALTLFFVLTIYGVWQYGQRDKGTWRPLLLAGLGLGGAWATKFSAAALVPMLGLLLLGLAYRWRAWSPIWFGLGTAVVGMGVITAVYRFHPAPFWADLAWQFDYFARPHGAFLWGQAYEGGHWLYFPTAFAVKTSLPVLALLVVALAKQAGQFSSRIFPAPLASLRPCVKKTPLNREPSAISPSASTPNLPHTVYFGLPILVYGAISLWTPLNIGYRHLLPLLPFLYLWLAAQWRGWLNGRVLLVLIALLLVVQGRTWPDYLPYFNLLVGQNGWHILSDSNLDWGQDLPALAQWQAAHPTAELYLSYFGMARPSAYGVRATPLPTWSPAPEQAHPARQAFYPADPAPGVYALSVTNLQGVVLGDAAEALAYFRPREPIARLGQSIWLYEVAPYGEPIQLVLSGVVPAELPAEWVAGWATNQRQVRWLDASHSQLWPQGGGWLVVPEGVAPAHPLLAADWPASPAAQAEGYALYALGEPPRWPWTAEGGEVGMGPLVWLGQTQHRTAEGWALLTAWRVTAETERPLKIFVHLRDEQGAIMAQWDGLDVWPGSWRVGDVWLQAHELAVPAELEPNAAVSFLIGVYDGETGERLGEVVVR